MPANCNPRNRSGQPHGRRSCVLRAWAGVALTVFALAATAAEPVAAHLNAAAAQLPAPARSALRKIDGVPRRLLALRSYLRADNGLAERWSWTAQQISDYQRSDRHQSLLNAIAEVNARFAAQNPGYSVYANTEVRSLDQQLERWNRNAGVARAGKAVLELTREEMRTHAYPASPNADSTQRFSAFLRNLTAPQPIPLAAPGLSLHGQSRAIDFQIRKGDIIVAGPRVATVAEDWEKQGWARKLERAIDPGLGQFVGPLRMPNEPWHYEYVQ